MNLLIEKEKKKFYIYCWYYEDTGQIFYIGKGQGDRYKSKKGRSSLFKEISEINEVDSKILIDNLKEEMALEIEKKVIKSLISFRYPLINIQTEEFKVNIQRKGIAIAKQEGKYKGRKPIDVDNALWNGLYTQWKAGELTARSFMNKLNLKPNTFYRKLKEYQNKIRV
jgi:hypothetical protein